MEAFRGLLDEIDTAFRQADFADFKHGLGVFDQAAAALSMKPDLLVRLKTGLRVLRELRAHHARKGRAELAADAARLIAEIERNLSEVARLSEAELERRGLGLH